MGSLTKSVESLNITVEVGGIPVRISTVYPNFASLLQGHYAGFLTSGESSDIEFDVEIKAGHFEEGVPELQVKKMNGRWELMRGDFHADWEPSRRRGRVVQGANPFGIDAVLRIVHSLIQAGQGGFLLHAASVIRNGKAFLFAGESGAGKTTISGLAPNDATLLTDENSYVRRRGETYVAFGTPFTSAFSKPGQNTSAPISAMYVLAKGLKNRIDPIKPAEAVRAVLANVLFFAKDEQLVRAIFDTAFEFVNRVPVSTLTFVPDARVWELIG